MCTACQPVKPATAYRHRWEMPMVWIASLASLAAVVLALGVMLSSLSGDLDQLPADMREMLEWFGSWGWLVLAGPLLVFFTRIWQAAQLRANSAKVGPTQFADLWEMYAGLAARMEVSPLPDLYVTNGNGVVNAYALSCSSRWKYVSINAELAHHISTDPRIVEFVLAHELAHHKLGHVGLLRIVIGILMNLLFLPGKALIRAQEYSADRLAAAYCPQAVHGIASLSVGPWLAEQLNPDALLAQAGEEDRSLMIRLVNIASDHAVMTKRYKALRDVLDHGFDRHGQMF